MSLNFRAFPLLRLGFGISGPHGLPLVAPRETISLIEAAFEAGIRFFDTGPSYGNGEAERRLGTALSQLPANETVVSTKAGLHPRGMQSPRRDFTPDAIERSVRASRERLRVERLDIVHLHGLAPGEWTPSLAARCARLVEEGIVGAFGLATRGKDVDGFADRPQITSVMLPVGDVQRRSVERLEDRGALIVGIEALASALPDHPLPTTPGRAFRLARSLLRGTIAREDARRASPQDALHEALSSALPHGVIVTTTRRLHLDQLVDVARDIADRQMAS